MASFDVNSDFLSEILSRTDLKTMKRCRILSKECNSITYESGFMQSHKERTNTICGYLIQSFSSSRLYSSFLDIDYPDVADLKLNFNILPARHVWVLATVDSGLVFCRSQYPEDQHYICKPTSKQWEIMPSPNPKYFATKTAMIALRSDPLWFKIVRLSDNVDDEFCDYIHKRFHCEIFDSSVWAWKQVDDLALSYYEYFNSDDGISVCGGLHWVTRLENKYKVLSFHPYNKESWESTSVPDSCNDDNRLIRLTVYEGKLAILSSNIRGIELEVWIMKDCYGEKFWDKKYSIDLEKLEKEIGYSRPVSFYNTDTLLLLNDFRAIFYNFKNHQHHQVRLDGRYNNSGAISFVQTDDEPIQLKQKRKGFGFSSLLSIGSVFFFMVISFFGFGMYKTV